MFLLVRLSGSCSGGGRLLLLAVAITNNTCCLCQVLLNRCDIVIHSYYVIKGVTKSLQTIMHK
jgi:hypothetical protein